MIDRQRPGLADPRHADTFTPKRAATKYVTVGRMGKRAKRLGLSWSIEIENIVYERDVEEIFAADELSDSAFGIFVTEVARSGMFNRSLKIAIRVEENEAND